MSFALVGAVAFLASGLTLYSGFGLGTILLPAFAVLFPAELAVAATAVVHLLNNLFKAALVRRHADWRVVLRFGLPAIPAAVLGGWLLTRLGGTARVFEWRWGEAVHGPTAAGCVIGAAMIGFALLELQPWFQKLSAPPRLLPLGGVAVGLIGGLTGQQGALRSMFLLRCRLDASAYIATGVMIAVLVDLARLPAYAAGLDATAIDASEWRLIGFATACAFAGAWLGARHLRKATIGAVRAVVATLMIAIGAALLTGLVGA